MIPAPVKRAIDRVRAGILMRRLAPINAEYIRRYGLDVRAGPFTGMRYLDGLERTSGDLVSKLGGTYEEEIYPAVEEWKAAGLQLVVNVGCAEGFYAVGLARALPQAQVLAYDIDPRARALCERLAQANSVADRVRVEGECTPETLAALPAGGVGLVCDCEGCEKWLLDPQRAPVLRGWRMIVELHDLIDPTITETVTSRFAATHDIDVIPAQAERSQADLEFLSPRRQALALSERPLPMSWAILRPRGGGTAHRPATEPR
jgi:SAM-dependent methyltransferase